MCTAVRQYSFKYLVIVTSFDKMLLTLMTIFIAVTLANTAPLLEEKKAFDSIGNFDPEELVGEFGEHFEGDMLLTPEQERDIFEGRNGILFDARRWPNRTVVYYIKEQNFNEDELKMIEDGMADIESKSCIKFRPRNEKNEHAVTIQSSGMGCFASVGYNEPNNVGKIQQILNLQKGCFEHGTIVHEILHTLGFYHMHTTYDRDDYVDIVWDNILAGTLHNFAKHSDKMVTNFGVPYDYVSVMHYPEKAFSKNGEKTIIPLKENVTIGQRVGMSESDILKLNKMYCEEQTEAKYTA